MCGVGWMGWMGWGWDQTMKDEMKKDGKQKKVAARETQKHPQTQGKERNNKQRRNNKRGEGWVLAVWLCALQAVHIEVFKPDGRMNHDQSICRII